MREIIKPIFHCVLGRDRSVPRSIGVTRSQPATLSAKRTLCFEMRQRHTSHETLTGLSWLCMVIRNDRLWKDFSNIAHKKVTILDIFHRICFIFHALCERRVLCTDFILYVNGLSHQYVMCSRPRIRTVDGRSSTQKSLHSLTVLCVLCFYI